MPETVTSRSGLGSYPGLRRGPVNYWQSEADLRALRAARGFPANDPRAFGRNAIREFVPVIETAARRMTALEMAEFGLTTYFRAMTFWGNVTLGIGLATTAYAILSAPQARTYERELPRNPNDPRDMKLYFPPSMWHSSYRIPSIYDDPNILVENGTQRWYQYLRTDSAPTDEADWGGPNSSLYDHMDAGWYPQIQRVDQNVVMTGGIPLGKEVMLYQQGHNYVDGKHWTFTEESHYPLVSGATADYANPPQTETVTETVEVPVAVPLEVAEPARWAWEDLPAQLRHPFSDAGYELDPTTRPEPEPDPAGDPVPIPPPIIIEPGPSPTPSPRPGVEPPPVVLGPDPAPNPGPSRVPQPPVRPDPTRRPRRRGPPGRGEKERKARVRLGRFALALRVIGLAPEFLDAINALYDVLPKSCKPGYYKLHYRDKATGTVKTYYKRRWRASQAQRIQALYRCWNHMDMADALKALLANQIEDQVYGRIGSLGQRATRHAADSGYWNRPLGLQAGPWDTDIMHAPGGGRSPISETIDSLVDEFYRKLQEAFQNDSTGPTYPD